MKLVFDERPGEIFDFFKSLWTMNNYDYLVSVNEEYGLGPFNSFENSIIEKIRDPLLDRANIEKYFYQDLKPEYFLGLEDLWKSLSIDSYLKFLKNLDDYEHIIRLDRTIQMATNKNYESNDLEDSIALEDLKERILNVFIDRELEPGLKWLFYLALRDPKKHISHALNEMEAYLPLYHSLSKERDEVLADYNQELSVKLKEEGLSYLLKEIDHTYDFQSFKEVKVTTSALVSLRVYSQNTSSYVLIGPSIRRALLGRKTEDDIEKNLNFIRGISESTRYKIIQLLSEREYYGQEIADSLNITKTNAFYHLDFLLSLKLVNLIKDSQKNYYSLNREVLNKNIEFYNELMKK